MEWVPPPQLMLKALEVANNATCVIEKFGMSVQNMYPAIRDIYTEHIHSIKDYEGWVDLHERHHLMTMRDANMLIANRKKVKQDESRSVPQQVTFVSFFWTNHFLRG